MPKIAEVVALDYGTGCVVIDGEALPWFVAEDVTVEFDRSIARVTVTILAERVEHVPARNARG